MLKYDTEENTWAFERVEHYLERRNLGNGKIFYNKA